MKQTALLLSAILFALGITAITRAQGGPASKILICDFAYIVENCDEAVDIQEKFQKERQDAETRLKAEQQKLQLRIKEIQEKTKLSDRDDKVYEALKKAIEDEGALKAAVAYRNVTDQDFIQRQMQELLRGAKSFANDTMIAQGADMVLATKVGKIQLENQQDWQDEMLRRRVVCHKKGVNITDIVMKMMNAEYAKRKGGG